MTLPNFFLVGAAKCGTTSLHHYLSQHPQVFMATPKEPRHFDTDMPSKPDFCVRDPEAYEALYDRAKGFDVVGEASPSYLPSRVAAGRIREACPDARILITLRNPIDFMRSLHRQLISSCNEDLHDFATALEAEPDRAVGKRIPKDAHYPGHLTYRHNARFAEQVERYFDAFGRDRVKIVLMEDLASAPEAVVGEILAFLGLPEDVLIDYSVRNVGSEKRLRNFRIRALMKRYPLFRKLVRSIPVSIGTRVSDALVRVTGEEVDARTAIDPALRLRLTEEFSPEIRRLGVLINRDLSGWLADPTPSRTT